jgi:hypothetical protein
MNIGPAPQPNPWQQVGEVVGKITKNETIYLKDAQKIWESLDKTNEVDQKILAAWENAFLPFQNVDPNARKVPLNFLSYLGIQRAVIDATCRALQNIEGFNIATAKDEKQRLEIVGKVLDALKANPNNRIAIYDQSEDSFYVYKVAENTVQWKTINKSAAMKLPSEKEKNFIGAPNPEKA